MNKHCSIPGCINNPIIKLDSDYCLFSFPQSIKKQQLWIHALDLQQWKSIRDTTIQHFKICSVHFAQKYILKTAGSPKLTSNAIPFKIEYPVGVKRKIEGPKLKFQNEDNLENSCKKLKIAVKSKKRNICSTISKNSFKFKKIRKKNLQNIQKLQYSKKRIKNPVLLLTTALVLEFLKEKLPTALYILVNACLSREKKFHRWSKSEKDLSFSLYFKSSRYYEFLRNDLKFVLPGKNTILGWLKGINIAEGLSESTIKLLKITKDKMKNENDADCVLILDEMAVKKHSFYDKSEDVIYGLSGGKLIKYSMVFMVRGLIKNWKLPIGFYFTQSSMNGSLIKDKILEVLNKLNELGYNVRMCVCDQGSNNRKAYRLLGITNDSPYIVLNDKNIYFSYDMPHIIKSLRNNLARWDIVYDNKRISWEWVKRVYYKNRGRSLNLGKRICHQMVFPSPFTKMKVKYATKIFSNNIASSIFSMAHLNNLPSSAFETAKCFRDLNKFFDIFNSRSLKDPNPFKCAISTQNEKKVNSFLVKFKEGCLKWKLKVVKNKKVKLKKVPCFNGIVLNINSFSQFWTYMKNNGLKFLITSRCNQDPLENFFSVIRSKNGFSMNPTCKQFAVAFKTTFFTRFLRPSKNANCFYDSDQSLAILESLKTDTDKCNSNRIGQTVFEISDLEQKMNNINLDIFDINSLNYVSGFVINKLIVSQADCKNCSEPFGNRIQKSNFSNENVFTQYKDYKLSNGYDRGSLFLPTKEFEQFLCDIVKIFKVVYDKGLDLHHPRCGLLYLVDKLKFSDKIKNYCTYHLELASKLFINMLIFNKIRDINDEPTVDNKIVKSSKSKFNNK